MIFVERKRNSIFSVIFPPHFGGITNPQTDVVNAPGGIGCSKYFLFLWVTSKIFFWLLIMPQNSDIIALAVNQSITWFFLTMIII